MSAADTQVAFLVDDDEQLLRALARLLREHGVATAAFGSAEAFLLEHDSSQPGCLVLDVNLPGLDGPTLQQRLAERGCSRPIIFLTGFGDIPASVRAIKAGAVDFLSKPVTGETLLAAVRDALVLDARARSEANADNLLRQRAASLTAREHEVLQSVAAGKRNKQIACELGISEATVKFHRSRLMKRMQASTAAELMRFAARLEVLSTARSSRPRSGAKVPHTRK